MRRRNAPTVNGRTPRILTSACREQTRLQIGCGDAYHAGVGLVLGQTLLEPQIGMDVSSAQTPAAANAPSADQRKSAASSSKEQPKDKNAAAKPKKRRRWPWIALIVLALGFLFLPHIVAATAMRNWVVGVLYPELPEGVTVRSATFAWWEPLMLAGVEVPDDEGHPLVSVEHITTDATLWELLILRQRPGRIDIEQPHLSLRVSPAGTNLDPILARFGERPPSTPEALEVHVTDADAIVTLIEGERLLATCADFQIDLTLSDGPQHQFQLAAAGTAATALPDGTTATTPAPVQLEADWTCTYEEGFVLGPGRFSIVGSDIVASEIAALIPVLTAKLEFDGVGDISLSGSWDEVAADNLSGTLAFSTTSDELTITPVAENDLFPEPVTLNGELAAFTSHFLYSRTEDRLDVGELDMTSRWLNGNLSGEVTDLTGETVVQLTGTADGDPAPWIDLLPPDVSDNLVLEGVALTAMSVTGTLRPQVDGEAAPPDVEAAVTFGWTLAKAFGLTSTDGQLKLGWNGEALTLDPVNVPFNGGRVVSLPDVLFREDGVVLRFAPGALFEIAEVDEEIAREWLRYLSPLLASATSVEGSLSMSTAGGEIPLARWQQSDFQGTLTIHEARISPGPRARTIMSIVRQFEQIVRLGAAETRDSTLLTMPPQDIILTIGDERVHHDQLKLMAGQIEMSSSGSVGFDETLDLLLSLPILDEWVEDRPLIGNALRGETISLGVAGTLDDPDLDASPIADLSIRMGARAGAGLLWDRIFGGDEDEEE